MKQLNVKKLVLLNLPYIQMCIRDSLMPADIQLSGMEVSLVNAMSRETILRQYLDTLKGQYSHILIDCQPSLGMLTVNAPVSYTHLDVYKRQ